MKFLAIIEDTFREGIARKTILAFFIISTLFIIAGILVAAFADTSSILSFGENLNPDQKEAAAKSLVGFIQAGLAGLVNTGVVFLGIFATASIIPHTLEKGNIDLLLSKPVSRTELLLGKMTGSILIVFFNVLYFILAMWVITSLKTGYWNWAYLLSPLSITYAFFVLYTVLMVLGITSRSTALSLIVVYLFVFIIEPILASREMIAEALNNETISDVLSVFYYILPKTTDIGAFTSMAILGDQLDWMPIWSSGLFAVAMIGLSVWIFRKKEF